MIQKSLILLAFFLYSTGNLRAQKANKDSLDLLLTQAYQKTQVPGFTAIVLNSNGIVYQKSLGFADMNRQVPYTPGTLENIGSVSKTFIAVALMKAIDLGYFNLETDINTILPFQVHHYFFPGLPITIRQLATHTSGIVDNDSIYHKSYKFQLSDSSTRTAVEILAEKGYSGGLADTTLETFLESYLTRNGRLYSSKNFYNSKPGDRSSYSNIASALVAYLIQLKSGMSFAAFTHKYILGPLQMRHSDWFLNGVDMSRHAIPYLTRDLRLPFYSLTTYPDGGLISSAEDLSKYAVEMIKALNGKAGILSERSAALMFSPAFPPGIIPQNFNASKRTKGVFWNLYTDGFVGHDGDDPGVSTNLLFNRYGAIIFMTNIYLDDRSEFLEPLKRFLNSLDQNKNASHN